ncbi:ABC transporter permease [Candidatus Hepatobacter penaei]|uniref:ABC transporter permease n=1 Tax=Candidatus Hepatobacter penaei TaxID=1274402 RepID=UPI0006972922|nr:ABC transporter permease subunit [Candidatus Hepatobacter penaei]TGW14924.1 ABC transporter permease subunit [bacterium NHP-B]
MSQKRISLSISWVMAVVYAFLYAPIAFVVLFSFNASASLGQWSGFSLVWYRKLLMNTELWQSVARSFQVAFFSATCAVLIGLLCALLFVRFRRARFRGLIESLSVTPLVVPEVAIGLALLVFFVASERLLGWPHGRGLLTVIVAHTTIFSAYTTLMLRVRLLDLDPVLEEAALDLGAQPSKVFFSITLPLIVPSLVSAWILIFVLSMDDLVIASFTSGPSSSTLPMVVFSQLKTGITPEMNALSSLIILFVLAISPLIGFFMYVSLKKK